MCVFIWCKPYKRKAFVTHMTLIMQVMSGLHLYSRFGDKSKVETYLEHPKDLNVFDRVSVQAHVVSYSPQAFLNSPSSCFYFTFLSHTPFFRIIVTCNVPKIIICLHPITPVICIPFIYPPLLSHICTSKYISE